MTKRPILFSLLVLALLGLVLSACAGQAQPTPTPTHTPRPPAATPAATSAAVADAWQRVQSSGRMVVAVSADYPPFESYDENFKLDGFDIALMKIIGQRLGVEVEFNDFAFDGLFGAIQLGQADAAISAISETQERREQVDFSDVYFISHGVALGSDQAQLPAIESVEDMRGLRVAVEGGTTFESWADSTLVEPGILQEADLHVYTDVDQAVKDVQRGLVDVVLLDLQPAQAFEQQGGLKIVGEDVTVQRFAIALPKGQDALRRAVNKALAELQSENLQGQCVTISWNAVNVKEVYYYQQGQDWQNHDVAGQGSRQECPQQTTTYYLRVVMPDNSVQTRQLTVTVTPATTAPQIVTFSANPQGQIQADQCVSLQWNVTGNISDVLLSRNNQPLWDGAPYQGSYQDCPPGSGQMTYVLRVTGPGGTSQASQTITVMAAQPTNTPLPQPTATPAPQPTNTPLPQPTATPAPQPTATPAPQPTATPAPQPTATPAPQPPTIDAFSVDSGQINLGECLTISWSFSGTDLVAAQLFRNSSVIGSDLGPSGQQQDCPPSAGNVEYRIQVDSEFAGSATRSQVVSVVEAQPTPVPEQSPQITSFQADPP